MISEGTHKYSNGRYYVWLTCPSCSYRRWVRADKKDTPPTGYCRSCAMSIMRRRQPYYGKGFCNPQGYKFVPISLNSPYASMARSRNRQYVSRSIVLEHRLIMAMHLGRCLEDWEVVHHLNGIKDDNRIENLSLEDRNSHKKWTFVRVLQEKIRDLEGKDAGM